MPVGAEPYTGGAAPSIGGVLGVLHPPLGEVGGGHLMQFQLKYLSSKSMYTSATPRCSDLDLGYLSGVGQVHLPRCGTYTIMQLNRMKWLDL